MRPSWHRYQEQGALTAPGQGGCALGGWGTIPHEKKVPLVGKGLIRAVQEGSAASLGAKPSVGAASLEAGKLEKCPKKKLRTNEGIRRQTFNGEKFLGHHQCGPEKEVKGLT